ncbi:MAG: hypothetical protein P4L84_00605 [Isosphaeraceae bacterium]|nr:hypothetical protein [Isosphaeraceae bacterium]
MDARFARLMVVLGFVAGTGFVGCGGGDDLPRQSVSGTVTLGGQPLAQGRIEFEPASPEAKTPVGGEIKDGAFRIPRDQGPTPGDYKVMITASGAMASGVDTSPGAEPPKGSKKKLPQIGPAPELIPKEYNSKTTLTAKVEAGKSNTFDFPLNAKK